MILVDKPAGVTSHDVVAAVRRSLGRRRTGHAGTLDPFATGLLLVLVGRATRIQRFLMVLPKTYRVVARLGAVSSTGDPEGELTQTGRLPDDRLELPTGRLSQRPPAYSAVHVDGVRAHRRARRGETFEVPERCVTVHRFERLWREGERAAFEIECSAGTYVRSLISGLGDAYCEELRRTAIGPFSVGDAQRLAIGTRGTGPAGGRPPHLVQAPPEHLAVMGIESALAFLPTIVLAGEAARRARHGQPVEDPDPAARPPGSTGQVLLLDEHGAIAIAEPREVAGARRLKPAVVLTG